MEKECRKIGTLVHTSDVTNCGAYRKIKLLEHGMMSVERLMEKGIRALVEVDSMQFGFMARRGTTDAHFIVQRMPKEHRKKDKKLYMCFVDLEKAFGRELQEEKWNGH